MRGLVGGLWGLLALLIGCDGWALDLTEASQFTEPRKVEIKALYDGLPSPRVLAATDNGHYIVVGNMTGMMTAEQARKLALERCQIRYDSICRVIAVEDVLQPDPKPEIVPIPVSGPVDYQSIPTLFQPTARDKIQAYRQAAGHKAFAIAGGGAWGDAWGFRSPMLAAMVAVANCEKIAKTKSCFVYDLDGRISSDVRLQLSDPSLWDRSQDESPAGLPPAVTECSAHLRLYPEDQCEAVPPRVNALEGDAGLAVFTISGQHENLAYSISQIMPFASQTSLPIFTPQQRVELILRYINVALSPNERISHYPLLSIARYDSGNRHCAVFFRNGRALGQGVSAVYLGAVCDMNKKAVNFEDVAVVSLLDLIWSQEQ